MIYNKTRPDERFKNGNNHFPEIMSVLHEIDCSAYKRREKYKACRTVLIDDFY